MTNFIQEDFSAFDIQSFDFREISGNQTSQPHGEKFLVFYLDEEPYAISTKYVAEATASFPITVLPNSPGWLLGLGNLRGEIASVINLPKILQKKPTNYLTKHKFIFLRSRVFELAVAFKVDRIGEILTVAPETIEMNGDANHPYFIGKTSHKFQAIVLLDSETLLSMQNIS